MLFRQTDAYTSILDAGMPPVTRDFEYEGHRLVYDEYGAGEKVVVLLPGLLFSRRMHAPAGRRRSPSAATA